MTSAGLMGVAVLAPWVALALVDFAGTAAASAWSHRSARVAPTAVGAVTTRVVRVYDAGTRVAAASQLLSRRRVQAPDAAPRRFGHVQPPAVYAARAGSRVAPAAEARR